jgi:uncharacterized protein YndB with AHSA1/START domain
MVTTHIIRHFSASVQHVFDAWLDASKLRAWIVRPPWGGALRIRVDARVGGAFSFIERCDGEDRAISGRYLEVARPHRLAFTWIEAGDEGRVTVDVWPSESGCSLHMLHEASRDTRRDWVHRLDSLDNYLARDVDSAWYLRKMSSVRSSGNASMFPADVALKSEL